jgi:hypothetical protein
MQALPMATETVRGLRLPHCREAAANGTAESPSDPVATDEFAPIYGRTAIARPKGGLTDRAQCWCPGRSTNPRHDPHERSLPFNRSA